jgi:endonuclease/exonuclease/phosphatase family metal-dependent hydrolase
MFIMNIYHKVILIIFICCSCGVDAQIPASKEALRICSFNIHYDKENDSIRSWDARKKMVLDLITTYNFDLVGAQEVKQSQLSDFKAMDIYGTIGEGINGGNSGMQNTILYKKTRFALLDSGIFWLSERPEIPSRGWDATYQRNCSWGKFRDNISGKEFFMFNTHFDHEGDEAKINSAYLIYQKITEIANETPALFMGDLNSEPDTEAIKFLNKKLTNAREASESTPTGPYGTGHGFRITTNVRRIDYIFSSKEKLSVKTYETIDKLYNGKAPSDHFPVFITIDFLP